MTYYGDKAPEVTATVITVAVIAYAVFAMRVHTRLWSRAWGADDWCMTAATVSVFRNEHTRSSALTI